MANLEEVLLDKNLIMNKTTMFSDLDEKVQDVMLAQRTVIVQGKKTSLKELLAPLKRIDLDEMIDSDILSKLVRNEQIVVGKELTLLDETVVCCYVSRQFRELNILNGKTFSEELMKQLDNNNDKEIIAISDITGGGKSTTLTNLANAIKRDHPNLWVLRINLDKYSKSFSEFKKNNLKSVTVLDLLNSNTESKLSGFEQKLYSFTDRVLIMLDGIDEVCSDYKDIVFDLIADCRKRRKCGHFVKRAQNLVFIAASIDLLVEMGMPFCNGLEPFTQKDQIYFFKRYWEGKFHLDDLERERREMFTETLTKDVNLETSVVGIPLQLRMLAETFEKKEHFDNRDPLVPKRITLIELYQSYICRKCCRDSNIEQISLRSNIKQITEECDGYLFTLALESVLTKEQCDYFNCYRNGIKAIVEEKLLTYGIIEQMDNRFRFTHATIAKYFVAECVVIELRKSHDIQFFTFFIEEILIGNRFNVVRTFLDSFIQTDLISLPEETYEFIGRLSIQVDNALLYTSAREGCLGILKFLFKCFRSAGISIDVNDVRTKDDTAFHSAVHGSYLDVVEYLLQNGADIESRTKDDCTALHLAAKQGNFTVVKFLIERGADVKCKDGSGRTALHEAAKCSCVDMVNYLLAHGACVNSVSKYGYTALHEAAELGDLYKVKCLVENGADVNCRGMYSGWVLSRAVASGNLNVVKYLVEKGADVSTRSQSGGSMLHVLLGCKREASPQVTETIKYLLEKGVDINSVNEYNETILCIAIENGCTVELLDFLMENGANIHLVDDSLLDSAIMRGDLIRVKYLLEKGVAVDVQSKRNDALYEAVMYHHLDVLTYLAERGVSVDVTNNNGYSALDIAVSQNDFEMVKFLVERGAGIIDDKLLKKAIQSCNLDIVKFLIENGTITNVDLGEVTLKGDLAAVQFLLETGYSFKVVKDVGGDVELLRYLSEKGIEVNKSLVFCKAAKEGDLGIIRYLVENGVDVDTRGEGNRTALHEATDHNHFFVSKYLVAHGARVNLKDEAGSSALHLAATHGNLDIIKALIDKGVDVNSRTDRGLTALHLAVTRHHLDAVKFLVESGARINVKQERIGTPLCQAFRWCRLHMAEFLAEKDPDFNCKIEEVMERLLYTDDDLEVCSSRYGCLGRPDSLLDAIFFRLETIKSLAERGVELNDKIINNHNLLHRAVISGDLRFVKFLIGKGAAVNLESNFGHSVLYNATDLNVAKILVNNGAIVNVRINGRSILSKSIEVNNLDFCKFLVKNGAQVDEEDGEGFTLLHMAATCSFIKVKYLLDMGAKLKLTKNGRSVLHEAIATGYCDIDTVKILIENGEDVNLKDKNGRSPLDEAVARANLDVVKLLTEKGVNIAAENIAGKRGILYEAANKKDVDLVKYLIKKGAEIDGRNDDGSVPLHAAASNKNFEIIKLLIENGADVNAINKNGGSILHEAIKRRACLGIVKILVENGADINIADKAGCTVLHGASSDGNYSLIRYLIERGASLNVTTINHRSVLHEAAAGSCLAVVKLYVKSGVDVNISDKEGATALYEAARNGHLIFGSGQFLDVMKVLIENGAEVNTRTRKGRTPLHEAASKCNLDKVKLLVESGADLNAKDEYGHTALFAVLTGGRRNNMFRKDEVKIIEFLAKSGADFTAKANNGRTALHEACDLGNLRAVQLLVDIGGDVNDKTIRGHTTLHVAAKRGISDVVEFLVKNGVDIGAKTSEGCTALDEAVKGNHVKVAEFLKKIEAETNSQTVSENQ